MASDTLVLTAKLVGDWEQTLKQQQRVVKQFEAVLSKSAPEAAKTFFDSVKKGHKGLKDLGEGTINLRREMKAVGEVVGKLTPGVSGLTSEIGLLARGAGSFIGIAAALAAATGFAAKKLGDYSDSMRSVRNSAKLAKMSLPDMRDFIQLGARWGKSSEEMQGAAVNFAESFEKIKKNIGGFRHDLEQRQFPVSGKRLADYIQLHPDDMRGALQEAFKIMEDISKKEGPVAAKKFAEAIGLPASFSLHTAKDFTEGMSSVKSMREEMGVTDQKLIDLDRDAEKFRQEWKKTEEIYGLWGDEFKRLILPDFTALVKAFNELIGNKKAVTWAEGFAGALLAPLKILRFIKELIDWLSGSKIMQFLMSQGGIGSGKDLGGVPGADGGGGGGGGGHWEQIGKRPVWRSDGGGGGAVTPGGGPLFRPGVGPRARGGGGGDYGSAGPNTDGATAAMGGDGSLPSNVLAEARRAALTGGSGAVKQYMAAHGYPNHGENWCGEFAAAVVVAAGGTPPKNPAVASNWRNWGKHVDAPMPGDIAVRRGTPTGATGSHVTFVENVGQGTFTGLGGNQGRAEATYPISRFDFYRSQPRADVSTGGRGGGGGAGAGVWGGGTWMGDPALVNAARGAMDSSTQQKIEGKGTIDVHVNQQKPRGKANARSILKPVPLSRAVQRAPAESGPPETAVDKPDTYGMNL